VKPDPPFAPIIAGAALAAITPVPPTVFFPIGQSMPERISYLTIELRGLIPADLRHKIGNWIFGCDICQMVCPWNRFAAPQGDEAFGGPTGLAAPVLQDELALSPDELTLRFRRSPIRRARPAGYLRNLAVGAGNSGDRRLLPALRAAAAHGDPILEEHSEWAIHQITNLDDARE
jgi:epoxyqueuosine reductase